MGRWSKSGGATHAVTYDNTLPFTKFSHCTYVEGITLTRFMLDEEKSKSLVDNYKWFWVYHIPNKYNEMQCDACVKTHSPKNIRCSATLHRITPYIDSSVLYDFTTGMPAHRGLTVNIIGAGTVQYTILKLGT